MNDKEIEQLVNDGMDYVTFIEKVIKEAVELRQNPYLVAIIATNKYEQLTGKHEPRDI